MINVNNNSNNLNKICSKCGIEKSISEYTHYSGKCKDCYKKDTSERVKNYREKNKKVKEATDVKICKKCGIKKDNNEFRQRRKTCRECYNEERLLRYENDKNDKIRYNKIKEYKKEYRKKSETDPVYKLASLMRSMIKRCFRKSKYIKESKTNNIIGISFVDLRHYLEKQFQPWMSWENHGLYNGELNYGWDIDHIEPLFPEGIERTEEDIIRLNHYTNLQPLCSKINRDIKKNKFDFNTTIT